MNKALFFASILLASIALLPACSSDDGGGSNTSDVATDTGVEEDTETGEDTGTVEDTETGEDTGTIEDTETGEDTGTVEDTETGEDTGTVEDTETGEDTTLEDATVGPQIVSVDISPDSVDQIQTGMTDQFFTVVIQTEGFQGTFQSADVLLDDGSGQLRSSGGAFTGDDSTDFTEVTNNSMTIPFTWLNGLDPGVYNVDATVVTDTEDVTETSVTTIEITDG